MECRQFFLEPATAKQRQYEALRKQNHSVYEISEILKERNIPLSPTAVREALEDMSFAALPRRLDEQRPRPTREAVADVRELALAPRTFVTRCGGLFLFVSDLVRLAMASGLYRLLARRMRGYADSQARQVFRDLVDMPADVAIGPDEIVVRFHRRAHLPIVKASGLLEKPVPVPWLGDLPLRLTT